VGTSSHDLVLDGFGGDHGVFRASPERRRCSIDLASRLGLWISSVSSVVKR
jgi:hypothetical protein